MLPATILYPARERGKWKFSSAIGRNAMLPGVQAIGAKRASRSCAEPMGSCAITYQRPEDAMETVKYYLSRVKCPCLVICHRNGCRLRLNWSSL